MTVMCLRIVGILRADHGRIRTSASECKTDMDGVFDDESGKMAAHLCKLRATQTPACVDGQCTGPT
jgi:hypothetical protein